MNLLRRAVTLDPADPLAELALGRALLAVADGADAAIPHHARAVKLDPGLYEGFIGQTAAQRLLGDESGARSSLGAARRLRFRADPDSAVRDMIAEANNAKSRGTINLK